MMYTTRLFVVPSLCSRYQGNVFFARLRFVLFCETRSTSTSRRSAFCNAAPMPIQHATFIVTGQKTTQSDISLLLSGFEGVKRNLFLARRINLQKRHVQVCPFPICIPITYRSGGTSSVISGPIMDINSRPLPSKRAFVAANSARLKPGKRKGEKERRVIQFSSFDK